MFDMKERLHEEQSMVKLMSAHCWQPNCFNVCTSVPRVNILTHQNSYYNRIFSSLPSRTGIHRADVTIGQFKAHLLGYYHAITKPAFDVDVPQTFKTVCIKYSCIPLTCI